MAPSSKAGGLASLRRQHLLAEFSGLKQACPEGVYATVTPGDPTLWTVVLFVRRGPYAGAVLRFQVSFPDSFPRGLPPLVTFATDIFHPLVTPLTTYTYSTDVQDYGTVSATDDERLPPGGFSLRHGFPAWFGRARGQGRGTMPLREGGGGGGSSCSSSSSSGAQQQPQSQPQQQQETNRRDVSVYEVLQYIKSAFDDEALLDSVPREAAGNPGAWEAWHARDRGPRIPKSSSSTTADGSGCGGGGGGRGGAASGEKALPPVPPLPLSPPPPRGPGQWNWSGVWEDRVRKGIKASCSEAVLFGGVGLPEEAIHFIPMDEADIETVKANFQRTLGGTAL